MKMKATQAVSLLGLAFGAAVSNGSPLDKRDALADCLKAAEVPTDSLGSEDWGLDVAPFNLRLNFTPVALAVPTTVKHIQDAVACGAKVGIKTNAKCGGHSYASFGLGGEDGHLVIELDRMNNVTLDNSTGIAVVEAGARLGHLAKQLFDQGKRGVSHGTCPGVGVGGHALHGGYGVSSHTKGLTLDWVAGATIVLANSTVVDVSETEHPDLYWAIRGAGSSMGIITSFRFNTFPAPELVTFFIATVQWKTKEAATAGLKAVQEFALNDMPTELNMRVFITGKFINFEGLYWGDKANLKTTMEPLLNATGAKLQLQQEGDWMDQIKHFGNGMDLDQGFPYDYHEIFYSSSLYTRELSDTRLESLVAYWFDHAKLNKRDWYLQIDLHGGNTSAVTTPTDKSTSYAHRDYLFMYSFYDRVDRGSYPEDGFSCMQNFVTNITEGMTKWGQYINYPDSKMSQDLAQTRYWGDNLPRLQAIKAEVDPDDLFHYPQGIMPAVSVEATAGSAEMADECPSD